MANSIALRKLQRIQRQMFCHSRIVDSQRCSRHLILSPPCADKGMEYCICRCFHNKIPAGIVRIFKAIFSCNISYKNSIRFESRCTGLRKLLVVSERMYKTWKMLIGFGCEVYARYQIAGIYQLLRLRSYVHDRKRIFYDAAAVSDVISECQILSRCRI